MPWRLCPKEESGTAFTIVLPIALEGKKEVTPHAMIKPVRTARILVIDDEDTVREVLEKMLSQVNHRVTVARNGDEGLRLFREKEFDIVLTDLGMPVMSGWEVCKAIKGGSPNFPVGMITGWGMEEDRVQRYAESLERTIQNNYHYLKETMEDF